MARIKSHGTRLMKSLLEARGGSRARCAVTLREVAAESKFVRTQATQLGFEVFSRSAFRAMLRPKQGADTLFVLGSGSSVRDLTASNFEEIQSQLSVGINNWGIHPFVPDFYALESVPWVGDGLDFMRSLTLLAREDIVELRPLLLVLRPSSGQRLEGIEALPGSFHDRIFLYGRVSPFTRRVSNLEEDLKRVLESLVPLDTSVFVDSGASIVRMLGVAVSLGLKQVVFTGVDLNNSDYFWENNVDYPNATFLSNNQKGYWAERSPSEFHETMSTHIRPFSVTEILRALAPTLYELFGITLLVASPHSALADFLPAYGWHSRNAV